jgi:hypothetical protein
MSFQDRQALLNEDVAMEELGEDFDTDTFNTLPPGQEGIILNHAGNPEEVLDDLLDPFRLRK